VDLDAFVTEHHSEWNRLQTLSQRGNRLNPYEIDEMLVLYRRTATHLSVVRSRSGDPTLVAWLSRLVLQARSAIAPSAPFRLRSVARFFTAQLPGEIYRTGRWSLGVAAGFIILTGTLIIVTASDMSIAHRLLDQASINDLVDHSFQSYYSNYPPSDFAVMVWSNNAFVAAISLAGGVLILPVFYMLWANAFNAGIEGGIMVAYGRGDLFFELIAVHGLLELTCVFIAAGVGLRIGWAWIAPPRELSRARSLARAGRSGILVALGLVVPLAASGVLEAYVTPLAVSPWLKIALGAAVWSLFMLYVIGFGSRAVAAGESSDVDIPDGGAAAPSV
jgi:uncharacterized membrane protein SpoIIM required for sporulation